MIVQTCEGFRRVIISGFETEEYYGQCSIVRKQLISEKVLLKP